MERLALRDEFCDRGPPPNLDFNVKKRAVAEPTETRTQVVPEASDRFFTYRVGADLLAVWEHERSRWLEVLSR